MPVLFARPSTTAEASALRSITDLGTPPGPVEGVARGIDDPGQIIGFASSTVVPAGPSDR